MYDIEGKLKRRAMLERLEGLGRAAEATSKAVVVPDLSPAAAAPAGPATSTAGQAPAAGPASAPGPRHRQRPRPRNEPVIEPAPVLTAPEPVIEVEALPPDQVSLHYGHIDAVSAAPGAARYDPHQPPVPDLAAGDRGEPPVEPSAQVVQRGPEAEPTEPADPADPADPASSAATIADLLRHGAGRLFFETPRPPAQQ